MRKVARFKNAPPVAFIFLFGGCFMVKTGQAVKNKTHAPTTVVIKPKKWDNGKGCVYRRVCANRKDAELCVSMHEAGGDRAFILES